MRLGSVVVLLVLVLAGPSSAGLPPQAAGALASDNVEFVVNIPEPGAFGGRILGDTLYMTGTQGLRIYDLSHPTGIPVLLGALNIPHFGNEDVDTNGEILLIATDHVLSVSNRLYVVDVSNPRLPMLLAVRGLSVRAHTASCILDCAYAWIAGNNFIEVIDLQNPAAPVEAGRFYRDGSSDQAAGGFGSHDVNIDEAGIAWVSGSAGLFGFDPSEDPVSPTLVARDDNPPFASNFIIHNSMRPHASQASDEGLRDDVIDPGELLLVTEEDWLAPQNDFCANDGRFQTGWMRTVDGETRVERLDTFNLGRLGDPLTQKPQPVATCSSHYFDYRDDGVVAVAWYEQGIRFLDVSDPHEIKQVGFFMPATTSASATLWHRDFLYTFDLARGIDVLRFTGTSGDPEIEAPLSLAAPAAGLRPSPQFGYACRIEI